MTTLFSYASKRHVTLANALKDCGAALQSPKTYALLYAPNWLKFGLLDGNAIPCDANGKPINLDPVYEARVFNQGAELRWLNEAASEGQAVLISESEYELAGHWTPDKVETALSPLDQTYLLWGIGVKTQPGTGWSRLTTARIGRLDVPIDIGANLALAKPDERVRVLLEVKEYLAEADTHGNVVVCDERLWGLKDVIVKQFAALPANKPAGKETNNG